jgi:C4-dicarboxylate-specific signal transduction histidine kinase
VGILKEKNKQDLIQKSDLEDKLQKMEKRIVYMSKTIEDFMSYYNPNKEKSVFALYEALNHALDIVPFDINSENVTISVKGDFDIKIYALMNEYVQVVVSILTNISDTLTQRELLHVKIDIELKRDRGMAVLSISDSAGGIDEEILSKIFDPYFTTKHQSIGTGLGLYIAKMIIENNMGGSLSAKNHKDGALFLIKVDCVD